MGIRRLFVATALLTAAWPAVARAVPQELSATDRLADRRAVVAGERSYAVGFEDGAFYANGWHTAGEMGGVWAAPVKLLDGVWFGVDGQWTGPATRFTSGYGYTRYDLPDADGFQLSRTDFAPDGDRAVLFGLRIANPSQAARTATVTVDAHSELMGAYPWGSTSSSPTTADNLPDHGAFADGALRFTDDGALPGAPDHHYAALVAADRTPVSGTAADTGGAFRGGQGDHVCTSDDQLPPSGCDDGPFGRGTGGELTYSVDVPAGDAQTLWVAAAGSDAGLDAARTELAGALHDPAGALARKVAARTQLASRSRVSLPGDPLLAQAVDWGKQNLADLTQTATDLQVRWTNQGKQYPAPLGTVPRARWFGAGYPDYPWLFATDGEYTAFAAVALGQFEVAEDHLRALRDVSDVLNDRSGIVVHETVSDGSVWFGHDSTSTAADGTTTNDFNTDETIKLPSAVALVWRWTGDARFRHEMYDFSRRALRAVATRLDADGDGWPEGSGNVERTGMGPEKLDNAVYYLRALLDLADMARAEHDPATATWAQARAATLRSRFDTTWWDPTVGQFADSLLDPGNAQSFQKHWIGQVPMEAELVASGHTTPGVATLDHGTAALAAREDGCYSGARPGSLGLFHTGCGGGADGAGDFEIFSLGNAIQAVGEGNYGRLGPTAQQRYTDANAEAMLGEPATGGTPDEQPGALPEILPSTPDGDASTGVPANIDRCWTCRSMVMQAWGTYGTAWPVIHQQLGVRPYLDRGALEVVPQVPPGQPGVAGSAIRLGTGAIDVRAARSGARSTTWVDASRLPGLRRLTIGYTLDAGRRPAAVLLDGRPVRRYAIAQTNRGLEVTVRAATARAHTLVVVAR